MKVSNLLIYIALCFVLATSAESCSDFLEDSTSQTSENIETKQTYELLYEDLKNEDHMGFVFGCHEYSNHYHNYYLLNPDKNLLMNVSIYAPPKGTKSRCSGVHFYTYDNSKKDEWSYVWGEKSNHTYIFKIENSGVKTIVNKYIDSGDKVFDECNVIYPDTFLNGSLDRVITMAQEELDEPSRLKLAFSDIADFDGNSSGNLNISDEYKRMKQGFIHETLKEESFGEYIVYVPEYFDADIREVDKYRAYAPDGKNIAMLFLNSEEANIPKVERYETDKNIAEFINTIVNGLDGGKLVVSEDAYHAQENGLIFKYSFELNGTQCTGYTYVTHNFYQKKLYSFTLIEGNDCEYRYEEDFFDILVSMRKK